MNKMGESAENYLETILILLERNGNVRAAAGAWSPPN